MWHMMGPGPGFFFGFIWLLIVLGIIVSWFFVVNAVLRIMKSNEQILSQLIEVKRSLPNQPPAEEGAQQEVAASEAAQES